MDMGSIAYEFKPARTKKDLFSGLLKARKDFGGDRQIIVDGDERVLTYNEVVRASFALGSALKNLTEKSEHVAVMLPTGAGAVIAFYALQAYGRIPAMFNFTAGSRNLKAAGRAAQVKKIVTAHKFIELGNLQPLIDELKAQYEIIYLEDVREDLSIADKARGALGPIFPNFFKTKIGHKETGVILFTSGTEGDPKGVVLSHENVMANVEQVRAHIELFPDTDVLFNPLPTFHCFGLTVGAVLPLMAGIKSIFHPTPLQPKEIVKRIRKAKATILLATDTFISQYARAGDQGDLDTLRLAVCGAERVRDETRQMVRKKYNIEILEGYGATEASPVVAANQIGANVPGTVGQLMSGMEHKLEPVPGIDKGGKMLVRGPNIMKGYLRSSSPGVIEPPKGGWHDTGDICTVDEQGFIRIRGRVKRFAKVGGEMISLAVVENCASAIWPDNMHAAAAIPDTRKGEQIVLLSDAEGVNRPDMLAWAQNHGVSELSVPRKVFTVDEIPVLGTGKVDYGSVTKLAHELAGLTDTPA
tara:strand:+ start:30926 stop:32512 length:1587 start_codon:yes stop_codon:yes gene_type:complete